MSPLEYPIRRFQPTLVAFMCLVALGIYAFLSVPREEDPLLQDLGVHHFRDSPGGRSG